MHPTVIDVLHLKAALCSGSPSCVRLAPQAESRVAGHFLPTPADASSSFAQRRVDLNVYVFPSMTLDYRSVCRWGVDPIVQPDLLPAVDPHLLSLIAHNKMAEADLDERIIEGPVYIVCSPRFRQYGHFLTEVLPRLLIVRELIAEGYDYPIAVPSDAPSFLVEFLGMVVGNVTHVPFNDYREVSTVSNAILPGMASSNGFYHPWLDSAISSLILRNFSSSAKRRLFIQRQDFRKTERPSDIRIFENEAEIAGIAQEYGFELVEPQKLTVGEQVQLFSEASVVIGEASSALHNTLFSPKGCAVLSLNYMNGIQTTIAALRGHSIDYLLPDDGIARNYNNIVQQQAVGFQISAESFRSALPLLLG